MRQGRLHHLAGQVVFIFGEVPAGADGFSPPFALVARWRLLCELRSKGCLAPSRDTGSRWHTLSGVPGPSFPSSGATSSAPAREVRERHVSWERESPGKQEVP